MDEKSSRFYGGMAGWRDQGELLMSLARWFFLLLSTVTLYGCGSSMPSPAYRLNAADRGVISIAMEEWARHVPEAIGKECQEDLQKMRVAVLDGSSFREQCGRCEPGSCPGYRSSNECPWGCVGECYTNRRYGGWPHSMFGKKTPIVVIHPSIIDRWGWDETLLHGAMHWLEDCTGRGYSYAHQGDVWGKAFLSGKERLSSE